MDSFVARQPIFDRDRHVYGYELLFRTSMENRFPDFDPDKATCSVMMDTFIVQSIRGITDGKRAFINFSEQLLLDEFASYLPKDEVVIEVLETIPATREILKACHNLREAGYLVALDDFVIADESRHGFLDCCDIVKINFSQNTPEQRVGLVRKMTGKKVMVLAEKVETLEEFNQAMYEGFEYFQGYFFCKPEVIQGKRLSESKLAKLELIKAINAPDPDFGEITEVIKHDVSLTYKILRYINSSAYGFAQKVDSIHHAIVYMGVAPLKKWVTFLVMAELADEKPSELIMTALIRARFCEQFSMGCGFDKYADDLFLLGLFSRVDAIIDRPIEEILEEIPLSEGVKTTLLGNVHEYGYVYDLVKAYEDGDWDTVEEICTELNIELDAVAGQYAESILWAQTVLALDGAAAAT